MAWSKADSYSYRTKRLEDGGPFVGLCAEFPDLSCRRWTQPGAMQGIMDLVKSVVADMPEDEVPIPITERGGT